MFITLFFKPLCCSVDMFIESFLCCLFCSDSYLQNNNIQVIEASAFYKMYKIHTM